MNFSHKDRMSIRAELQAQTHNQQSHDTTKHAIHNLYAMDNGGMEDGSKEEEIKKEDRKE